jgi:hypothetical protein
LADAHGVARWAVQHLRGVNGAYGVGVPDAARLWTPLYGAGPLHWALFIHESSRWCAVHSDEQIAEIPEHCPKPSHWPPTGPIHFTADLKANRLTAQYGTFQWDIAVPLLADKHIYFAIAMEGSARLIVDDDDGTT